ncbi:hypothetical protein NPIRD3C_1496 [Nitrosopumilus piranensis]|uniref:Uncharacterized protein n=1 Tax=Nitrosopumilus piranensis TaxID=1582439 RepID=A0A0C5BSF0_9ARCH|nr:hypothetical protein NPIRD3C_1496 [Nitrosopumilus piranensis]
MNQLYFCTLIGLKSLNYSAGFFSDLFALPFLRLAPKLIKINKNPTPIKSPYNNCKAWFSSSATIKSIISSSDIPA